MAKDVASLIRQLEQFGQETTEFVKNEVIGVGYQIDEDAKRNAASVPNAPSELAQFITVDFDVQGTSAKASIRQNLNPMGAYIEFGTGVFVTVAPEWKDMAWQFYVNGKGRLHAHPYLYPAFIKGRDDFMITLQRKIEMLANQFNRR